MIIICPSCKKRFEIDDNLIPDKGRLVTFGIVPYGPETGFGYIKSLTYTVPESGDWDAETALPRFFEIAISYQILSRIPPAKRNQAIREYEFYGANKTIAESDKPDVLTTDPPIVDDIGLESQIA